MKKIILLFSLLIIVFASNAQSGASCATAISLMSGNSCLTGTQQNTNDKWFSFVANTSNLLIKTTTTDAFVDSLNLDSIKVYGSVCGDLVLIAENVRVGDDVPDSILALYCQGLQLGATYYIKTQRVASGNVTFNICKTEIYINTTCPTTCNLVPNGDFEAYNACPNGYSLTGSIDVACWYNPCTSIPVATSDYFNSCSSNFESDVPINVFGTQFGHSGNGYVGIYAYHINDFTDYREYLQIQLGSTLIAAKTYNVQMWVSLADVSGLAVNKMGIYFSNAPVAQVNRAVMPSISAQVVGNNAGTLSNKGTGSNTVWTQIQQNYTAVGGEQYITIGNFYTNANSGPVAVPGAGPGWTDIAYYFVDDVSVTPINETITAIATPAAICIGSSSTLTATNGTGYTWAPATGLNSTTGGTVIATPSVTTTYTVTSACLTTQTVKVTVNGTTVTVSPATICLGTSTILTASGANTYTWSPATGLSATTGTSVTANPVVTTIYTVTGTNTTTGCTGSTTVIVTVNPLPTVSASATPNTIVAGSTSQLTASFGPGYSYSWQPTASLNNPGISNPIANPTITTTYTVTVTDLNGCTAKTTVLLTVIPAQCALSPINYTATDGQNSSTVFGATTTLVFNKNITITGTLNINQNITFNRCNVIMAAGAKINLTTGNLTLSGQTHIYSCTSMWDGIYVPAGRTLTIQNSSFIEDAINAVVSTGGGIYTINTAIFNKNIMAVDVRNFAGTHTGTIVNSIVTSRELPISIFPINNKTVAALKTTDPLTSFTPTILKPPYADRKGCYGINVTDVTNINIGSDAAAGNLNIFDWIMCGIKLTRSNAIIYNNQFQNLVGYNGQSCPSPPAPCYFEGGYGIKAASLNTGLGTNSITVGGPNPVQVAGANPYRANIFSNTYQAIYVQYYQTQNILGNSITNSVTGPLFPVGYGKYGIMVTSPAASNVINIQYQTLIKNCETGIYVNRNTNNALNTTSFSISNNGDAYYNSAPCITADANGYCTTGIYIADLLNGTLTVPTGGWRIDNNKITETRNCISLLNVKDADGVGGIGYVIPNNSCTVRYSSGTTTTNGIVVKSCSAIIISANHIKYNNIGGTAYTSGGNINSYGIYVEKSTNMLVMCNKIDDAARSLVFNNTCTSAFLPNGTVGVFGNTMSRAQDGFVLMNSGVIGTQGNSTYPSNNYWDNTTTPTFTRSQTMADGSHAINSKLYVNNTATTLPTSNGQINVGFPYSGTSLLTTTGTIPFQCGTLPEVHTTVGLERDSPDKTAYAEFLKTMAEDTKQLPVYSDESHWQRRKFVFNEIKNDAALTDNAGLQKFYNDNTNANIGKLAQVDDNIRQSNFALANSINSGIVPTNTIEQNQKTINDLILRKLINAKYTYTIADKKVILTMADQCPITGGDGVYQARVLLMSIENNVIDFVDNCNPTGARSMEEAPIIQTNTENKLFKLYPNPNDGNMLFEYSLSAQSTGTFVLYDITGRVINKYKLTEGENNSLKISESELINGVYFYSVIIDDTVQAYNKIVIVK